MTIFTITYSTGSVTRAFFVGITAFGLLSGCAMEEADAPKIDAPEVATTEQAFGKVDRVSIKPNCVTMVYAFRKNGEYLKRATRATWDYESGSGNIQFIDALTEKKLTGTSIKRENIDFGVGERLSYYYVSGGQNANGVVRNLKFFRRSEQLTFAILEWCN